MKILIPYSGGSHYRSLGLWIGPELERRGHEVRSVTPTVTHQQIIGDNVSWCDILVTSSPWWDYVSMWISAARHFKKLWVYHPEGWDNIHPVLHETGHQKNQGWPFFPDMFCAHGEAMIRAVKRRKDFAEFDVSRMISTGGPRFDIYRTYWKDIFDVDPFRTRYGVPDDLPVIMISTAALWDHHVLIEEFLSRKDKWHVVVSQHQCDHVEMYEDLKEKGAFVIIPDGCDIDDPTIDHGYLPSIKDSINYARQLAHADIVVNMAGSASLEAMILGTPVINIRTPGPKGSEREHSKSLSHYMPGAHYVDVHAGRTSYLVAIPEEAPAMAEHLLSSGEDRKDSIREMLKDVLSITFDDDIPSANATGNICNAIESL